MSESEGYEEVVVASDGVTVTKRYEADEFPVPAIAFNFDSDRGEAVTVRLSDVVPADVAVEDLGFHPEYGSEYWTVEDDEISFEREIGPDAEYTTVYGIRATGTDNIEQFLTEPAIENVDPPLEDDEGAIVGEGDDAVKDVIAGNADSVPGLEEEDEDVETLDLKDPNNKGEAAADPEVVANDAAKATSDDESASDEAPDDEAPDDEAPEPEAASNGDATSVEVSGDTLVTALANELREQEVSKDDVKLLRKAFDLADEERSSVKARVSKLQQDVTDVIAYTDALEEFLDENGTAEEMIQDFRSDLEEFQDEVDTFESKLNSLEDDVVTDEDLAALEGDLDQVENQVEEVSASVDGVAEDVDDVEETVADLDDELDDLQAELADVREDVGTGAVEDRVDEIEADIVELKEWREQLSSVIGGE